MALAVTVSCNDPLGNYPDPENFQGFIEQSLTRVTNTPDGTGFKSSWDAGDYIAVKCSRSESEEEVSYMMALESDVVANFVSMDEYEPYAPYTAYYPASISGGELPAEQTYNPDGPVDVPMMAKSQTKYLMFRPICGAVEFKLKTSLKDAVVSRVTLTTDQSNCGTFQVDDSLRAIAYRENYITLNCKGGLELGNEEKSFWFCLPENSYTGVELILHTKDGRTEEFALKNGQTLEVKRAKITTCTF